MLLRLLQHVKAINLPPPFLHDKTQLLIWCWRKWKTLTGWKDCANTHKLEREARGKLWAARLT